MWVQMGRDAFRGLFQAQAFGEWLHWTRRCLTRVARQSLILMARVCPWQELERMISATADAQPRMADTVLASRPAPGFAPTEPHSVSALDSTGSVAARGLVAVSAATGAAPLVGAILEPAIALALQDKTGREVSVS